MSMKYVRGQAYLRNVAVSRHRLLCINYRWKLHKPSTLWKNLANGFHFRVKSVYEKVSTHSLLRNSFSNEIFLSASIQLVLVA